MYFSQSRKLLQIRLAVLIVATLCMSSCGGGGGGGGGSSGSNVFVAASESSGLGNADIGSIESLDPPPGNITVSRVIEGTSSNGLVGTVPAMLLDAARDQLYVSSEIAVYAFNNARFANGPVAFSRRVAMIVGGGNFNSLQLDSARDMLYVGDSSNGVRVYHNASTLNELGRPDNLPNRTISTTSIGPFFVRDIALDLSKDILYVAVVTQAFPAEMAILVFDGASSLNGTASTPNRTITVTTTVYGTMGLFVDAAQNRLYVADSLGSVLVFEAASTKTGSVTPDKGIGFSSVIRRLVVDTTNDRLYAAGSSALYIVSNISTVPPGNVNATAALAPLDIHFTAVAVRP
jgi:hypothetical protein